MVRNLLIILFQNNKEKIGALLSFDKIDTSNGGLKRKSLHITGLFINRRPTHMPIVRMKNPSFQFRYSN